MPAWVWPILRHPDGRAPRVSSGWGSPRGPTSAQEAHVHVGADIMYRRPREASREIYKVDHGSAWYELAQGSPVVAAGAGVVTLVGTTSLGTHVIVAHTGTGLITFYQHLERAFVRKGEEVVAGQQIGIAGYGSSGSTRHLHFEIRRWNGSSFVSFDPEPMLESWPVLTQPVGGRQRLGGGLWVAAAMAAFLLFGRH